MHDAAHMEYLRQKGQNMDFFNGKKVLITGASSGIGADLALYLASLKASLVLLARRKDKLEQIQKQAINLGSPEVLIYEADVRDQKRLNNIAQEVLSKWGFVDIIVANAGLGGLNPAENFSLEIDEEIMGVNYHGMVNTLMPFVPSMIARRSGHLVGVSSLAAFRGLPGASSYSASKRAQAIFLESLRVDLRKYSIAVTSVHPGFVDSEMTRHDAFPMPFKISTRASSICIGNALAKKKPALLYPWPMALFVRINRLLPNFIYDRLLTFLTRKHIRSAQIFH